ncbi:MAG TPA: signal peptidase I [Thermoanaerobaculia bacterium]|nr:signal peptidase I [Thermoanaerobaculia bacterium]
MRQKSLVRTLLQPIGIAIVLAVVVRAAVHIYSIPSASMSPTLEVGDRIVVTRYLGAAPERGHVIVFQSPRDERELLVKRVIAVPGDLVDARLGRVRIGMHTMPEPYVLHQATTGAIDQQLVPGDCYYVLGDNREESLDSRSWGVVPRASIVGRARLVLWSSPIDDDDGVVRASGAPLKDAPEARTTRSSRVFKWID